MQVPGEQAATAARQATKRVELKSLRQLMKNVCHEWDNVCVCISYVCVSVYVCVFVVV